jgi:hypothetical protein
MTLAISSADMPWKCRMQELGWRGDRLGPRCADGRRGSGRRDHRQRPRVALLGPAARADRAAERDGETADHGDEHRRADGQEHQVGEGEQDHGSDHRDPRADQDQAASSLA